MTAIEQFLELINDNKAGEDRGIYSICSAHRDVIRAGMLQAKEDNSIVLIESTSNQVDQFGGYTGMTPSDFVSYVHSLALETDFPEERILLGGDHLGPNAWQDLPAKKAMKNARNLIEAYVKAGYQKIHLDASMFCADDEGDRRKPLADEIVSSRAAELCAVAESVWEKNFGKGHKPAYIIGTEVPIPGGAKEEENIVIPTSSADASRTIEVTKAAFKARNLDDAWDRVVGVVVQPGVEFGDDQVFHYNCVASAELCKVIDKSSHFVYEAHSTDYQSETGLMNLVRDHFCILKVGPWLTFAFREALFALVDMENELLRGSDVKLSRLKELLEEVMLEQPKYWRTYYQGSEKEQFFKRRYSFSDRSRYYWPDHRLKAALETVKNNLDEKGIPLSLLSQYMPNQYNAVQEGKIALKAQDLILNRIRDVLDIYARACQLKP